MFGLNYLYNTICKSAIWTYNCIINATTETTKKVDDKIRPTVTMNAFSYAYYWITHLKPDINRDYNEIKAEWKSTRMAKKALRTLRNGSLTSKIALFQMRYKNQAALDLFKEIDDLGTQILTHPTSIYARMDESEVVMYEDGHCLFDAFAYAYFQLPHANTEICTNDELPREYLRKKVAMYEKNNYGSDETLKINIDSAIEEIKEKTTSDFNGRIAIADSEAAKTAAKNLREEKKTFENLSDEDHLQNYFEQMTKMSDQVLWGGQAELYALSKIFNVTICLEQEDFSKPLKFNEGQSQSITLVRVNDNHFNVRRQPVI